MRINSISQGHCLDNPKENREDLAGKPNQQELIAARSTTTLTYKFDLALLRQVLISAQAFKIIGRGYEGLLTQ